MRFNNVIVRRHEQTQSSYNGRGKSLTEIALRENMRKQLTRTSAFRHCFKGVCGNGNQE